MKKGKKTIEVDTIVFDNGVEIELNDIRNYLNEMEDFEDTIGVGKNYTTEYFYFKSESELKLEPILLELDVIRKSPTYEEWNHNVETNKRDYKYDYIHYWLSDGFEKFRKDIYKLL